MRVVVIKHISNCDNLFCEVSIKVKRLWLKNIFIFKNILKYCNEFFWIVSMSQKYLHSLFNLVYSTKTNVLCFRIYIATKDNISDILYNLLFNLVYSTKTNALCFRIYIATKDVISDRLYNILFRYF